MDTFSTRAPLDVAGRTLGIRSLPALEAHGFDVSRLPYSIRVLLENVLRHEDGVTVTAGDIERLARWSPSSGPIDVAFHPSRVLLQDFTGVPALVDLAALRDAMVRYGGDPARVDARVPVELVVDHSIQVDAWAAPDAMARNADLDYARNGERYTFLRWGERAFASLRVIPPNTGIVHQVNLEHLARVVCTHEECAGGVDGGPGAWLDTLVGTDSHTPMVNGLGVLGWGVGGIEAEACMLGQPMSVRVPRVVGVRITGTLREEATATDLVLHVTELLRRHGVVGAFVEFFGAGVGRLPVADRATLGNMAPEQGATVSIFPPDLRTFAYLRLTGRSPQRVATAEAYLRAQGLLWTADAPEPLYSEVLTLDLGRVAPCVAGPRRPQERVALEDVPRSFRQALDQLAPTSAQEVWRSQGAVAESVDAEAASESGSIDHGDVVIAAITSCTNTSNPDVMIAAGLLARNAVARGLRAKAWVKTSLAPGSRAVTEYLSRSGLLPALEALGFHVVGHGCTTCIGNSGPLPYEVAAGIRRAGRVAVAVLSGNRNFEGRIHADVRANYLMSPPLVVAYALAGRIGHDWRTQAIGLDATGAPVFLRDLWPARAEIEEAVARHVTAGAFERTYDPARPADPRWTGLPAPEGARYVWEAHSTYVRRPPWFDGAVGDGAHAPPADIFRARVLVALGDGVTTDHISPAGAIAPTSPAGRWLMANGVPPEDFNAYGARRGNHEVMVRGTFASGRLRNRLSTGREGGWTRHLPSGEELSIYDAAERYRAEGVPLVVLAGREYGSGSSRDWAAKGPALLGVRAVIAESYERIHRANLVGMGILPLELPDGQSAGSLRLDGSEVYSIEGIAAGVAAPGRTVRVRAQRADGGGPDGEDVVFDARVRIDTPRECAYFAHGGILPHALRQALAPAAEARAAGGPCAPVNSSDGQVDEGSRESFPASDPSVY
jgi:aconitate hydratase